LFFLGHRKHLTGNEKGPSAGGDSSAKRGNWQPFPRWPTPCERELVCRSFVQTLRWNNIDPTKGTISGHTNHTFAHD
jgi:hypothetical protein